MPGEESKFSAFQERGLQAKNSIDRVVEEDIDNGISPIFVGGEASAQDLEQLKKLKITHIVNATTHLPNFFEESRKYFRVAVLDVSVSVNNNELKALLPEVVDFISNARREGSGVLVHCAWGVSRSVTLVLAYLINPQAPVRSTALNAALDLITARRPCAQPNASFMRQLIAYECEVLGGNGSVDLGEYKAALLLRDTRPERISDLLRDININTMKGEHAVVVGGHLLRFQRIIVPGFQTRIAKVSDFLSVEECDAVLQLAATQTNMHRSYTAGDIGEKGIKRDGPNSKKISAENPNRTSSSGRLDRNAPVVFAALTRAAKLVGLTPRHSEALQVVHYNKTQQYREHYDFFGEDSPGYQERLGTQGQRVVTVFVYLSDCDGGGCTYFPKLNLRFTPKKGDAVLWYNLDKNGVPDESTLHAGEPVLKGEKWGMNIWLREREKSLS